MERTFVRRWVLACITLSAGASCRRTDARPEPLAPADAAPSSSVTAASSAAPAPSAGAFAQRSCRDGFLFELDGQPADVNGFGPLTDASLAPFEDGPVAPRVALTGTMGSIDGPLERDPVERVTCKMVRNLRSCFQYELKTKPKLRGDLTLEIDIALNGKVMQTRRAAGNVVGENLLGCISNAFLYATYPMPKAKTTFRYALQVKTHAQLSPRSVQLVESGVTFGGAGKLPTAIVLRIVRATYPRFRACYELGVDLDPKLKGTVTARFVIDDAGVVSDVKQGPTTIPDPLVASCVMGVFRSMTFPGAEGGDLEVAIPLVFANVP